MFQAKLSSKFQLSIPKALCEDLNLKVGQQFTLVARGRVIELITLDDYFKGLPDVSYFAKNTH